MFLAQTSWEAEVICTNNRSKSNKGLFAGIFLGECLNVEQGFSPGTLSATLHFRKE